jgi:hypothetical protein
VSNKPLCVVASLASALNVSQREELIKAGFLQNTKGSAMTTTEKTMLKITLPIFVCNMTTILLLYTRIFLYHTFGGLLLMALTVIMFFLFFIFPALKYGKYKLNISTVFIVIHLTFFLLLSLINVVVMFKVEYSV